MKKPYNVSNDRINTLFNILFQQAQDKNFKVFDNKTDKEILSVLENGNVGFNNANGNIFLCININGVLYKRSISENEPAVPQSYITQTYKNGTTWYRIYSNGWVEQGGRYAYQNSYGFKEVTLAIPMNDTDYCLLNCNNRSSSAGDQRDAYIISSTKIAIGHDYSAPMWYVCGYKA
jgi:hypothetical protein